MKYKCFEIGIILGILLLLNACSAGRNDSTFSILFIDVGQGDAALIECDGHCMLIDGGDTTAGDTVYNVLEEKGIQRIDILAISHLHKDHYGGLIKALTYASSIGMTISNATESDKSPFREFENRLIQNGTKITIPHVDDKFKLGSAEVEVVDVASADDNDSLVLLVTYGETRFLFTGDINENAQRRLVQKYQNEYDDIYKIDLIKMPHHGGETPIVFLNTFMPDYAIISVGQGNNYGQPYTRTLDMLEQAEAKVYRTDEDGDILVKSDGKTLSIECSK